jgi:glycosyltransferase involved in cell wall biosynthesis
MTASVEEYGGMQRELFGLVERFVVLNETARRMLVANGSPAEKLVLNRLGLSHAGVVRKPSADERPTRGPVRFGYVGRLHPSKGLTVLIEAVRSLQQDLDCRLEIRGPELDSFSRAYAGELRALAAGDRRVMFAPAVASAEVPRVLAGLDVLVIPSMWFENGPTIALEAMAAGTPIVASRVGNLAEIIDDSISGRLFDPGDAAALASVLRQIVLDPAATVDTWRRRLPAPRTMDDVTRDYLSLYAA